MLRMNLKDLASHLGVAVSTVSRVLAGRGAEFRISAETQKRVLAAAAELGVRPDELGRSLRMKSSRTLGLLVPDISNVFFATLARAVEHQARQAGYLVLLADSQESAETEAECARMLLDRRVDGLLLAPVGGDGGLLRQILPPGFPLVQVDRVIPDLGLGGVMADNRGGAREAVRWLLSLGHRRIACLQARTDSSVIRERVAGYCDGLAEAGLQADPAWLIGDEHSQKRARQVAEALFSSEQRPTAILTLSNQLALGALEAARSLRLAVPGDLSIITFDEQPWAELLQPPLSTIAQPVEEMGAQAVERMLRSLEGKPLGHVAALETRLIHRDSVGRVE